METENAAATAAPELDELVLMKKMQPMVAQFYPSQHSLDWVFRQHRREFIAGGAVYEIAGRLYAHPPTFKRIALELGQRKLAERHECARS